MILEHGTREDHLGTLERAREAGIDRVWTGDIRRNAYLRENLRFGQEEGIITVEMVEDYEGQQSDFLLTWTNPPDGHMRVIDDENNRRKNDE
jgi:hypothetical protein